jgi:hypothetical protein
MIKLGLIANKSRIWHEVEQCLKMSVPEIAGHCEIQMSGDSRLISNGVRSALFDLLQTHFLGERLKDPYTALNSP